MTYVIAVYVIVGLAVSAYGVSLYMRFRRARKSLCCTQGEGND